MKKTIVRTVDDYTQEEVETVVDTAISVDNLKWDLDLSPESREALEAALEPFTRHVQPTRVEATKRGAPKTSAKTDREQNKAIRDWWHRAAAAGVKLPNGGDIPSPSERGRIPESVIDLYHRHGGRVPTAEEVGASEAAAPAAESAEVSETPETSETKPEPKKSKKSKGDTKEPQFSAA